MELEVGVVYMYTLAIVLTSRERYYSYCNGCCMHCPKSSMNALVRVLEVVLVEDVWW